MIYLHACVLLSTVSLSHVFTSSILPLMNKLMLVWIVQELPWLGFWLCSIVA